MNNKECLLISKRLVSYVNVIRFDFISNSAQCNIPHTDVDSRLSA